MNPEDRLRELKDPDRWLEVRLPQRLPVGTPAAPRGRQARGRTVLAFAIAAVAIGALWFGLAGVRPTGLPADSSGPSAVATHTASPSPVATASSSARPTVGPAAGCKAASLAVRFIDQAGGAAGNWAQTFTIRNAGGTCSIPTTAVIVGNRAARSGNTSPVIVLAARSTTTLYLMAPMTCDAAAPNLDRNVMATVRFTVGGVTSEVGSFPALHCANPFLDR